MSLLTRSLGDSEDYANPFSWTVQRYGFKDLNESFAFYSVNGTNFGSPFRSTYFRIDDPSSSTTSASSSSTVLSTVSLSPTTQTTAQTTAQTTPQPTATQVPSGLSTGAKAGIGVGVALTLPIGVAIAWFLVRHQHHSHPLSYEAHNPSINDQPVVTTRHMKDGNPIPESCTSSCHQARPDSTHPKVNHGRSAGRVSFQSWKKGGYFHAIYFSGEGVGYSVYFVKAALLASIALSTPSFHHRSTPIPSPSSLNELAW
jgi:hypothetical protein